MHQAVLLLGELESAQVVELLGDLRLARDMVELKLAVGQLAAASRPGGGALFRLTF
jgi:hypothetical protein